jgi:hypothetical protein
MIFWYSSGACWASVAKVKAKLAKKRATAVRMMGTARIVNSVFTTIPQMLRCKYKQAIKRSLCRFIVSVRE